LQTTAVESLFHKTHQNTDLRFLKYRFAECPIQISLGALGKKWALLILRDIAAYKIDRFNRLLESLHGIAPRVLSTRLKDLEEAGLIMRIERQKSPTMVRWALTERGMDTFPILMLIAAYGSKWNANKVFSDGKPRKLHELFDEDGMNLIQQFL
jgi:DNA-binding HxlR family transcriptional regulator